MSEPTKYYSSIQENRVADYLDWKVVSGSGSRDCHPGDIRNPEFLGECKTHTRVIDDITFKLDVWCKIKEEAFSQFKKPVLIVDNGSQSVDHTWVLVLRSSIDSSKATEYKFPFEFKTNISFDESVFQNILRSVNDQNKSVAFVTNFDGDDVLIMDLCSFSKII